MIFLQHVHSDPRAQTSPIMTVPGWPLTQVWPWIVCVGGPETHSSLNLNTDPIKVQPGSVSAGHGCFEWSPSPALIRGKPWMWPWVLLLDMGSRSYQSLMWSFGMMLLLCTWKLKGELFVQPWLFWNPDGVQVCSIGKAFCKYECACLYTWKWLQLFKILFGISCNTFECDGMFLRSEREDRQNISHTCLCTVDTKIEQV